LSYQRGARRTPEIRPSEVASDQNNYFVAKANLIDKEIKRGGYVKHSNMPRRTGGMKRASGGGRNKVWEDVFSSANHLYIRSITVQRNR
jgi:hypothetical protein